MDRRDMKSLPDVLGAVLAGVARATSSGHAMQFQWASAAGATLAAHVRAQHLEAGVLRLACDSEVWAAAVRADEARLVQRLRGAFPALVGLLPEVS